MLIDRSAHLELAEATLHECAAGDFRLLVAEGGPGCGKSEFLKRFLGIAAESGAVVFDAPGLPGESGTPLGLVRRLAEHPALPDRTRERLRPALAQGGPRAAERLGGALCALSASAPLVIAVDDLHHADQVSVRQLLHVAHHARSARILLIGTESPYGPQGPYGRGGDPLLGAELLRHPGFRRITLDPLSPEGVAKLAGTLGNQPVDGRLGSECYVLTGGNPLLSRALLQDRWAVPDTGGRVPRPTVGGPFHQAVTACLARTGTPTRDVAGALAVLGSSATPSLLSRLLGLDTAAVDRALQVLELSGLTDGHRYRHPVVAAAALDHLDTADRRQLHERSALLLHDQGARATEVGEHLLAAQPTVPSWAVAVLRDAATQALVDDDAPAAIRYLDLACRACQEPPQRAATRIALAAATWRVNPSAAEHHLGETLADLPTGALADGDAALLVRLLIGCGRLEEAGRARARLQAVGHPRNGPGPDPGAVWPSVVHPCPWPIASEENRPQPSPDTAAAREPWDETPGPGTAAAVWGIPGPGTSEAAADEAERRLRACPLLDGTLAVVANAVRTLLRAGRTADAEEWCHRLLKEATARRSPGWRAEFLAILAEIALRKGVLADAEERARQALACLPGRGGSVLVGGPLACQVHAYTAMGRYDDATRVLHHPVPGALFQSAYGLAYLRARGHYHLATDHCRAALGDFLAAGRMAQRWGFDHPALLPWRTDAAQAFLRLGERAKAARMITEQLSWTPLWSDPHTRGVSLRLRARVAAAPERPHLLTQAVEVLQQCGDRLELARALADLGDAYRRVGESVRANNMRRRAWRMAEECGAKALCDTILPWQSMGGGDRPDLPGRDQGAGLSESELRVAILAANGNSNREIALQLCVTMSTVEQHLTRVYRKLRISRRQQLPKSLIGPVGTPATDRRELSSF
ncbi:helix-turn-helix transcriptional regulator [Streptomyces sp. ME19-01-6]|uniref:helix-turn-helix transcriptional regulator n=1 Tax=Streptomyces sp. ME19-01-6 TaxID=3028686 RepID=UPI0029A66E29|nr:LuxR C-terminal-related transcriptional regulator [Streptomyces sp. ME19-01-6]MDX3224855.1 LuxR C-terminal-related transcriptional regulator [Streptomyces sp. ME19-01-6]